MFDKSKSNNLYHVCDIVDLSITVKDLTYFTLGNKPSLVDVILICNTDCIGENTNF